MNDDCLFCKIVKGSVLSWNVFESDKYLAFLTPYPNTPGFTVVIPKQHLSSAILSLEPDDYAGLLGAARDVGQMIEQALGCKRIGLVAEGMGVDHAHIKLIPMHGIPDGPWKQTESKTTRFSENYEGYLTTHDGPRMSDEELSKIQGAILNAQR